jgi:hypothetical protein
MPVDELVTLIHQAAQDPSIVSLYGVFGNGTAFSTGGWGHLEEVRNAIQVFATSHRQHKEPGMVPLPPRDRKALYVYSNTFANPMGSTQSMQDYFLASAFSQIHLQPQGDLTLFGIHSTQPFFRDALQKYGITVHVWKHGAYKNMANRFTHSQFSKEHYENVAGILLPIHQHVCDAIYTSRHKQLKKYDDFDKFWSMVENAGSLPARVAHQIGFVDYLPRINPLDALVKNNQQKNKRVHGNLSDHAEPSVGGLPTGETKQEDEASAETISGGDKPNKSITIEKTDGSVAADSAPSSAKNNGDEIAAAPPVQSLNTSADTSASLFEKWRFETDLDHFKADAKISIDAYAREKAIERQEETKQWKTYQSMQEMCESSVVMRGILALMGYSAPYYNIPKASYSVVCMSVYVLSRRGGTNKMTLSILSESY